MTDTWRKSSYSTNQNDCVEVHGDLSRLRDSKNSDGPQVRVGRTAMARLVQAIKADQLG